MDTICKCFLLAAYSRPINSFFVTPGPSDGYAAMSES
ncbi:hypothetical protein SAMN05216501_3859 [Pseudomonas putida]|nr:hypothetical protein SAMN05216501_3859 [Pseudomonas putida]